MKPYGNGKKKILIIGERPEEVDDEKDKLWQGKNGRMLTRMLKKEGIDIFEDCLSINAVNCWTPEEPTDHEISCCRSKVWKVIKEFKPVLILPLGIAALQSVLSHRWKEGIGSINTWRGWQIPDRETMCWICPSFAVPFVNNYPNPVAKNIFEDDLNKAINYADVQFPYDPDFGRSMDEEKAIQYLPLTSEADDILMEYFKTKPKLVSFDYETTGLKPHAKGHKIVTCAIGDDENCFSLVHPYGFKALKRILRSKSIGKTAHNMKYEHIWTKVILGYEVQNWAWDSMLSSRIMNNGRGVTGLKFQVYVRFGIADYDSIVSDFLRSPGKGGNDFNNILQAPMQELRKYNGYDTIFGYKLTVRHMNFLKWDERE